MVWEPNEIMAGSSCLVDELGPQAKYSELDHLLGGGGAITSPSAEESLALRVGIDDPLPDEVDPDRVNTDQDCNLIPLRDQPVVPGRNRPAYKRRVRQPQRPMQDQYESY